MLAKIYLELLIYLKEMNECRLYLFIELIEHIQVRWYENIWCWSLNKHKYHET